MYLGPRKLWTEEEIERMREKMPSRREDSGEDYSLGNTLDEFYHSTVLHMQEKHPFIYGAIVAASRLSL